MNTEAGFLKSIIAEPEEDLNRLVFADWLSDHGQDRRGEFIRVQIELSRLVDLPLNPRTLGSGPALRQREHALWFTEGVYEDFASLFPRWFPRFAISPGGYDSFVLVRRGFLDSVTCTTGQWYRFARRLCEAGPIQRVEVTDKRPGPPGGEYRWAFAHPDDYDSYKRRHWVLPHWIVNYWPVCSRLGAVYFNNEADGRDALSQALLNFGRARAKQIRWCEVCRGKGEVRGTRPDGGPAPVLWSCSACKGTPHAQVS